jgi:hypothetical protein
MEMMRHDEISYVALFSACDDTNDSFIDNKVFAQAPQDPIHSDVMADLAFKTLLFQE